MAYIGQLSLLFVVLLVMDMYSETTLNYAIMWTVKPFLMPILLLLLLLNSNNGLRLERIGVAIALSFSCLGDILLMQHRNNLFIFGLASFLIAHISYVISFVVRLHHGRTVSKRRLTISTMIVISIPFLTYVTLMLYIFHPILNADIEETKGLFIPVAIYTCVIVGMAYLSLLRGRKTPGFWYVFIGAILFVMSDTILAFNKFVVPLPTPGLFIMFTYGIGQYLITIGTIQATTKDSKIV